MDVDLEVVVTPGLGDNSYLIASDGEAALVDPQRDVGRLLSLADARGASVRSILETHVHNDYVSGAFDASRATGAEIVAPADGNYAFPYRGVKEGDEIRVGALRLVAMETPGHTPEHTCYLLYDATDVPIGVFTGGSLMVGGAGRTDLLGPELTEQLTRFQYRTLRRLSALPDGVEVLPTHGQGSFCGTGSGPKERTSTLREERGRNAALSAPDEESFIGQQLSGLLAYPTYYWNMAPINRAGPRPMSEISAPAALGPEEVQRRIDAGAWVVDARNRKEFALAHLPRSINIEVGNQFASYVGWIVTFNDPLVLVLPDPEAARLGEAATQLARIGYERVEGYLRGGIRAWEGAGLEVRSFGTADIDDLCAAQAGGTPPRVLDVRQEKEWDAGHIPGSRHIFVGDLPERVGEVPSGDDELWVACASGQRASIAASILDREGVAVRSVVSGGVADWLRDCADPASA
ncbi:MAG: MBL fold metallo-hydrolase [Actinobacteria bacterium]|nr:MBL fold metallo-hydrolase [Actinomycetota bacterium]